jgi:3-dehydroquinate synthase
VRIPTTTLSQADSGVGVKNGLNAFGKKNFVGTFSPPHAVINDFNLLSTLDARDKRAGYSEAIKVACIRDAAFFDAIEQDADKLNAFDPAAMKSLIHRCAELHLNHITTSGDPFEVGSARPLDFGHWSAHKLEQLSRFRIRHGEAVAMGVALDVLYSREVGLLDAKSAERIVSLLEKLGLAVFASEMLNRDSLGNWQILTGLDEFREHLGGELTVTLLKKIGTGVEVHEMDQNIVIRAVVELQKRSQRK